MKHSPILAAPDDLADTLAPFVGAKLTSDRSTCVDLLLTYGEKSNIDLRAVTPDGPSVFFYRDCETVPWALITGVRVRQLDDNGNRVASRVVGRAAA